MRPQEVHVHLQLLQARAAQRLQPHALHQALEARARDACAAAAGAAHGAAGPAALGPVRSRPPHGAWCGSSYLNLLNLLAADLMWCGHQCWRKLPSTPVEHRTRLKHHVSAQTAHCTPQSPRLVPRQRLMRAGCGRRAAVAARAA